MDKKRKYEAAILDFLGEYAQIKPINFQNAVNQVVTDRENGHFQLVRVGWLDNRYIHNTVFHFDLVDGKVIVQQNRTDIAIDEELKEYGIEPEDVVVPLLERAYA